MKLKEMLKTYLMTTFTSYTFIVLIQTLLLYLDGVDISNGLVLAIFIVCLLVNLIIHFIHYLELKDSLTSLASVIAITIMIFLANYFLGNNDHIFEIKTIIVIIITSIAVYFFVIGIVFMKNSGDAKKINEKLSSNHRSN